MQVDQTKEVWWHSFLEVTGRSGWEYGVASVLAGRAIKVFIFEKTDSSSFTTCAMTYGLVFMSMHTVARELFPPNKDSERLGPTDHLVTLVVRIIAFISVGQIYNFITGKKFIARLLINFTLFSFSIFLHYIGWSLAKELTNNAAKKIEVTPVGESEIVGEEL
jgi:hypothetical protein